MREAKELVTAFVFALLIGLGSTLLAASDAPEAPQETVACIGDWPAEHTVCRPAPLRGVRLGGFLGSHVDANNRKSLPAGLESPIPAAFEARSKGEEPGNACRRLATDSDFYKWFEGACYAIACEPTLDEVATAVEHYADIFARLQAENGYLSTNLSPAKPFDTNITHDLYIVGHFVEAAVAHYKATGQRKLLDVAVRYIDFYIRALEDGHKYFEIVGEREHPEIELALVRLYRATGEKRFLDFAETITRMSTIGPRVTDVRAGGGSRHAVRFCYLMTGAAEIYLETGDESFVEHLAGIWNEVVNTRMYVTGGIGYNESIAREPYDLPQYLEGNRNRDIAETCASVGMMMFSWRMHAITGESRYMDVIENILYNHYLGAIAIDHLGKFYYNPLRRVGDLTGRSDHGANPARRLSLPNIHSTCCCLPNSWRFFAQLPEYVFSVTDDGVLVNLYTDADARHILPDGTDVAIEMQTPYPHERTVRLRVSPARPVRFTLGLRIPAWCESATVSVEGGEPVKAVSGDYHRINRRWEPGDEIVLELPMKPVALFSRPEIAANLGQVVFRRGPLVYCLERRDGAGLDLARTVLILNHDDPSASVEQVFDRELELYVMKARAGERRPLPADAAPYSPAPALAPTGVRDITLIPFYYRANRADDNRWITFIPYE